MKRTYAILLPSVLLLFVVGAFITTALLLRKPSQPLEPVQMPESPENLSKLSEAEDLLAEGNATEAETLCRQLIDAESPESLLPGAYGCLIRALVTQNRKEEAMSEFANALKRGVNDFGFKCEASIALSDRLTASKPGLLRFQNVFSEEEVSRAWHAFALQHRLYLVGEATLHLRDEHAEKIVSLLASPDPFVADRAMDVMDAFRPEIAMRYILKLGDHPTPEMRMKVAKLIARYRGKEGGLPLLREYLCDEDPRVKVAAIEAIELIGAKSEADALSALLDDPAVEVKRAATKALGQVQDVKAFPALLATATNPEEDLSLRCSAIATLGEMNAKEAAPSLLPLLQDPQNRVVRNAARALGELKYKEAIGDLQPLLTQNDHHCRAAAAAALGQLNASESIGSLIALLDDPKPAVRRSAARSLGMLRATEAADGLLALLQVEPMMRKDTVAWALGEIESEEAVPALVPLLKADDHELRREVIRTLEKIGSPEAVQGLILALRDRSTVNIGLAVAALGRLEAEEAVPELEKLLDSTIVGMPEAVMDTLVKLGARQSVPLFVDCMLNTHSTGLAAAQALKTFGEEQVAMDALVELIRTGRPSGDLWEKVELLVTEKTMPTLVELSRHEDPRIHTPASRILAKQQAGEVLVSETKAALP